MTEKTSKKRKQGQPTKYTEDRCLELQELMAKGYFNTWIAAEWKIDEDTFYEWRNVHPEFQAAYNIGMARRTVWWERKGMELMEAGSNKSFNYWIAFMNMHHNYKPTEGRNGGTTVNIKNMNVLQTKSKQDLLEIINTKLKALDMLPTDPEVHRLPSTSGLDTDFSVLDNDDERS